MCAVARSAIISLCRHTYTHTAMAKSKQSKQKAEPDAGRRASVGSAVPGVLVYRAMYKFGDDDGVHAEVLDFPGALTCADTLDEARRMLASALTDMVESYILDGLPIPLPDPTRTDPESDIEEPIYLVLRAGSTVTVTAGRA